MLKRARDILASESGISIVFAVLLVVVLLVMGGIIVSYGYAGYSRAVSDNADERTYQNVASAAKLVHEEFESEASSGSGWATAMLNEAANGDGQETRTLKATARDTDSKATFAAVTVTVQKVSDGSYDVACSETGNASSIALQFRVGYNASEGKIGSVGSSIERVGQ